MLRLTGETIGDFEGLCGFDVFLQEDVIFINQPCVSLEILSCAIMYYLHAETQLNIYARLTQKAVKKERSFQARLSINPEVTIQNVIREFYNLLSFMLWVLSAPQPHSGRSQPVHESWKAKNPDEKLKHWNNEDHFQKYPGIPQGAKIYSNLFDHL